MTETPIYWKTSLQDVEDTISSIKKGVAIHAATSPGGRPIYKIEYGKSNLQKGTATLSSALGAQDIRFYANKEQKDYIPTVLLVGCIHGGEFEGTCAILNLIKLLETGRDYAGNANDALVSLCQRVHLILIPVINPDGRSRIPFDSFVGRTASELQYYNLGQWNDGSLCSWPACKQFHPIKEYVSHLGGYFNDDGVNMMHENYFGEVSSGTRLLLDICTQEAPDFSILLHGAGASVNHMLSPDYASFQAKQGVFALDSFVAAACQKLRIKHFVLDIEESEKNSTPPPFNLISAMHHCCAAPVATFESNQGLLNGDKNIYGYQEIYTAHLVLFAETIRYCLKNENTAPDRFNLER